MKEEDVHTVQHEAELSGVWKEGDPDENSQRQEKGAELTAEFALILSHIMCTTLYRACYIVNNISCPSFDRTDNILWSSTLCTSVQAICIFFIFHSNIILHTNTLNLCSGPEVRDRVSH